MIATVRRLAAAIAVVLALPPLPGLAQPAASDDDPVPAIRLRLALLTGVLGPGAVALPEPPPDDPLAVPQPPDALNLRVLVENTGAMPLDELRLVVELHPAATSRGRLRAALSGGGPRTAPLHVHDLPVVEEGVLTPGAIAGVRDSTPVDTVPWADAGGVHPLRLSVVRGTDVLDQLTTAVIWLSEIPDAPVRTAMLWPIDGPPWRGAGERYPAGVDRPIRHGERIDALLSGLERQPDARVLLAPAAHLLEDLQHRADGFAATERRDGGALETRQVPPEAAEARLANEVLQRIRNVNGELPLGPVARPYAEADLAALIEHDEQLRELAGELVSAGRHRLASLLDQAPDPAVYLLPDAATPAVLDLVPADVVIVPYRAIEGPPPAADPDLPEPVRDARTASGRPVTLLVGDPHLSELLATTTGDGPVAAAQRILAETAMVYHEAPGRSDRSLVVVPPDGWSPSAHLAQQLIDGLVAATWLDLTSPRAIATSSRRGGPVTLAAPQVVGLAPEEARELTQTLADLDAVAAARPLEVPDLDGRSHAQLRDTLLRSTSRWYRGPARGEADTLLRDVRGAIDAVIGDLTIASGTQVTLTAAEGVIPVTLQRSRGGPIEVRVEVESVGRLTWPDGRLSQPLLLDDGGTHTVSFTTEALSTGTFPVNILVTDPSGRVVFDRATLSVRSTAIAGPALLIVAGVVVLLLLGGLIRRQPRRRLRAVA